MFTEVETKIYDYLTTRDITHVSATEIAQELFVSRSTIYNVCKKMGYDSYSQFKHLYQRKSTQLKNVEVSSMLSEVPDVALQNIITTILKSRRVYVFGKYATSIVGQYFERQLVNLGFDAILILDMFELEVRLKQFTENDCLVIFSNSGILLPEEAYCIRESRAETICITQQFSMLDKLSNQTVYLTKLNSKDSPPFEREDLFQLIVMAEKILINLKIQGKDNCTN